MSVRAPQPLLALHASSSLQMRLRSIHRTGRAFRLVGPVRLASSWEELGDLVARHPGSPAFVDPGFALSRSPFAPHRNADDIGGWRAVQLVWYANLEPSEERRLAALGTFVDGLRPGFGDTHPGAVDAAILRSIDANRNLQLLERLAQCANPWVRTAFELALKLSVAPCSVRRMAAGLCLSERTLQRKCAAIGVPSPRTLMTLARIFCFERLLHWSRQPAGVIAQALEFSARSNYRRTVRGIMGEPPSGVRERGGTEWVAQTIVNLLKRCPSDPASRGRNVYA